MVKKNLKFKMKFSLHCFHLVEVRNNKISSCGCTMYQVINFFHTAIRGTMGIRVGTYTRLCSSTSSLAWSTFTRYTSARAPKTTLLLNYHCWKYILKESLPLDYRFLALTIIQWPVILHPSDSSQIISNDRESAVVAFTAAPRPGATNVPISFFHTGDVGVFG